MSLFFIVRDLSTQNRVILSDLSGQNCTGMILVVKAYVRPSLAKL